MTPTLLLAFCAAASNPYKCGGSEPANRPYGKVEIRVDCSYRSGNILSRVEYKGDVQHGFQMDYDSLWRKKDSCFFLDGKENGTCLYWDSAGNVVGRETYRNGLLIGRRERYYSPGHPSLIKDYDSLGKEEGPWREWWKNGNLKSEYVARQGQIISGTEYYLNGKPRVKYLNRFDPENSNPLKSKRIEGEAWDAKGKSTGRIARGNGEWILYPDGSDAAKQTAFREAYKDSLLVKVQKLDRPSP